MNTDATPLTQKKQHDFANTTKDAYRKRYGMSKVKICRHCGCLKIRDAKLRAIFRHGKYFWQAAPDCQNAQLNDVEAETRLKLMGIELPKDEGGES